MNTLTTSSLPSTLVSSTVTVLATLMDKLDSDAINGTSIIPWSSPIPVFGDWLSPRIGTLGLNPSLREFLDTHGNQLRGDARRFHTLESLGLQSWSEVDARHFELIMETYLMYFARNPYDLWFKKLNFVIAGADVSFYDYPSTACHFDLVPFATSKRWGELSSRQRSVLLGLSGTTFGMILKESQVRLLVLNGSSVVNVFQSAAGLTLCANEMPTWSLERRSGACVKGVSYMGITDTVAGINLDRELTVIGFNHNLQSSFGVSRQVVSSIQKWIARIAQGVS